MKTILLLGGYGFLGTNILKYIDAHLRDEWSVIVFDKYPSHFQGVEFDCVAKSYVGDFSDATAVERIFEENRIDLVVHALGTTVPTGSFNAKYDIESNLIPTVSLVESMLRHQVKDIVYLSSGGAIYGNDKMHPHREDEDTFPISSYGVVKFSIEKYLMQYAQLYGLRPLILRISNPYGPWHYSMRQGICNVAMACAVTGQPFTVWGDGSAAKDYIYVEDFTEILFRLVSKGVHSDIFNVASGEISSVNNILGNIKKLCPSFAWIYEAASRYDVSHFELDTKKLLDAIGPYNFVRLSDGLEKTFKWLNCR